jgi:uncharacterized membrane protein
MYFSSGWISGEGKRMKYPVVFFIITVLFITGCVSFPVWGKDIPLPNPNSNTEQSGQTQNVEYSSPYHYQIRCDAPGHVIEAGESTNFTLIIYNWKAEEVPHQIYYHILRAANGWEANFVEGNIKINRLDPERYSGKQIAFIVETTGDSATGGYPIDITFGDARYTLYVEISRSHPGEKGYGTLVVTDAEGNGLKGATAFFYPTGSSNYTARASSSPDGTISVELPRGEYDVHIQKNGYYTNNRNNIRINSGSIKKITPNVILQRSSYGFDVILESPSITATTGSNPSTPMTIKNVGLSDDIAKLKVVQIPDGWFLRFKDSANNNLDVSELFIASGNEKEIILEPIPPFGATIGDYLLSFMVESSDAIYNESMIVKLRGKYEARIITEKQNYAASRGSAVHFNLTVKNTGNAGALTNSHLVVNAPEGWDAVIIPDNIGNIPIGDQEQFSITLIPPVNALAGDYKVDINMVSDQYERSDDIRISIQDSPFIAIFGFILLIGIIAGVYYLFKRYHRR